MREFLESNLVDKTKPYGRIKFIHKDGKEHCFWTAVNEMSGSRLSAFDNNAPDIDESIDYIKTVFRDIRAKAEVISYIGTKHFE